MGYMDNFKTSLNEVLKILPRDLCDEELEDDMSEGIEEEEYVEEPEMKGPIRSQHFISSPAVRHEDKAPVCSTAKDSVISADTKILGQIMSNGNLLIGGEVEGDITVKGDVQIRGKVKGNISANRVELNECSVFGNLHAEASLIIDSGSEVVGDIESGDTSVDGRIKGNILSTADVICKKNSFILGNVTSDSISIEKGAVICGEIQIKCPENTDELFTKYFSSELQ
jgi:cytoskeletal protein CcmA (bactofilin family)